MDLKMEYDASVLQIQLFDGPQVIWKCTTLYRVVIIVMIAVPNRSPVCAER